MNKIAAISVANLVKSYDAAKLKAVDGISFEVLSGQVFGLLGPNGAGKTTTIKMILGLVIPTEGSVQLNGCNMATQRALGLRHVGAILEGSRNIYWRLSARANLEYFGALRGMQGKTLRQRIDELLELVDLLERAEEETRYLSRGMQQKVALAVALLHDPAVLLLDEPTLGLDVQAAKTIEKTIQELVGRGKTVLLTTHQMALAEKLCDRVFVIHKGRKIAEGPTRTIIQQFGEGHQTLEIQVGTELARDFLERLQGQFPLLAVSSGEGKTILSWADSTSQHEMMNLLNTLDGKGIPILQVGRREATLEEVFVQLTGEEKPSQ